MKPRTSTRTRPRGCPVRSLMVCHSPAGVDAWPQAEPHPIRIRTKSCFSNFGLTSPAAYSYRTSRTSYFLTPPGVCTSTWSPADLPINARAMGEPIEILPFLMSASSSPTI